MTYNVKYTLYLRDGSSLEKEVNIKNKSSEYEACNSLVDFLKRKYDNYRTHAVNLCTLVQPKGGEQVEYLKSIFGLN